MEPEDGQFFSGRHPYRERRFLRPGDELNHDDDDGQKDGK